jgi:uncharacterized protein YyaL (SSP411 family)
MTQSRRNRLAQATSPYLQQHADNPVDWYPWGPEALERARREDKPIFLSIGYSTCHWCHVMAHECFENPAIAALMNEHFVNIKLDREERPDLDETYMNAVVALTGRGGWPLSVFLTPDLRPYYGGTYFPPEDRGGMAGFPRLLLALSQAYRNNQEQIATLSGKVIEHLQTLGEMAGAGGGEPSRREVEDAARRMLQEVDREHGGFGGPPKFPRALEWGFLLHYHRLSGDPQALEKLAFSLEKMARSGIYDQVGGGFHRYAVDAAWVVPHFEKMLYDNALLVPLYLAVTQLTGTSWARRVARDTLDFVLRDLAAPDGGFYAAWDADSEGQEGKFYLWSLAEVEEAVGPEAAPLVVAGLGLTREGNFEGLNICTRPLSIGDLAARFSLTPEQAGQTLAGALNRLRRVRSGRVPPHRDEKIIVSWNALMISALAQGAQVLEEPRYGAAAARAARFILKELFREDRLYRIWTAGQVGVPGFSEDYACLAHALLDLFDTDFDPAWVVGAQRLAARLEELFLDPQDGAYFYVAQDQETPLVRSKSIFDQVLPSGNSMAARVCLRLYRLTEEGRYRERALAILRRGQPLARENPWGLAHLLTVAALNLIPPLDLTLVGEPGHPRMGEMLPMVYRHFLPERRLLLKNPADCAALEELVPAARTYQPQGETPVAYLCHNFACRPPLTNPDDLAAQLGDIKGQE